MSSKKAKNPNPYKKPEPKKTPWGLIALCAALVVALGVGAYVIWGNKPASGDGVISGETTAAPDIDMSATHQVEIEIQDYGTIKAELYGNMAPITVQNFVKLAQSGFYDGLTFHRIISGFMIQGGDPLGTGLGGSEEKIKGEFSANGVVNPLSHTRGVLSMARNSISMDSASSQFFIMHQDRAALDGQYAAFGKVTEGIEIVDAICQNTPVTDNNGTVPKANQPIITAIRVVEAGK